MPNAPKVFRSTNAPTRKQTEASWQSRRNGNHGLYNLWVWRKPVSGIRAIVLRRDPLCVECLKDNRNVPSKEADHIKPHGGDYEHFVDLENLQGLCKSCHSRKTMNEQRV